MNVTTRSHFLRRYAGILTIALVALGLSVGVIAQSADAEPKLINAVTYSLPVSAIEAEIGGTVVVAISLDETGKPLNAALAVGPSWPCGERPSKALDELSSTLSAKMMELRFSPAIRSGKPAPSAVGITIQLKNPRLAAPPAPVDPSSGKPEPTQINGGVVNGKAISLPKPLYPVEGRANRDSGAVTVAVVIDEKGRVVRAGAVSGARTLQFAAREAACRARFSETLLMGNPVKVSGVITYNFVP